MPKKPLNSLLRYLQRMGGAPGVAETRDGDLLKRFARARDESAFELLVWRHGPMVLGLCQRLLHQEQDAEDAFQATFLALARKAGSIADGDALAAWLYKVAYRVACRARSKIPVPCNSMALANIPAKDTDTEMLRTDLRTVLDREIAGLPERYRRVMVLCYFEGKTHEEAARLMRCPKGTVSARVARARDRLGRRLKRQGWALSSGALASVLAEQAVTAAVPASLARNAVQAALAYTVGKTAGAGILSANAVALTEGVLRMMCYSKLKIVAGMVLGMVLVGSGIGLAVRDGWAGDGQDDPPAAQSPQNPQQNSEPDSKEKPAARRGGINRADLSQAAKLEIDVKKLRKELAAVRKELKDLKETPASDNIVFEVIRLRNAKAQNVTSVLNNLFQGNPLLVLPVEDNNSLLVKGASPADFKKIQNLVETVLDRADVDSNAVIRTRIIGPLKYARAADVAKILCAISDDGSVAVDERTNSLVLTCDTATIAERAKLVEQMEKAARDVPPSGPRVITLKSASAAEMAKLLRELYRDAGKSSGFSAAAFGGRLVLRCSPELAQEIEALVRELDVK